MKENLKYSKPGRKLSKKEVRKRKPDFKKWANKYFSPGSNQIPRTPFNGIGDKKPVICDICKKEVFKTIGEFIGNKLINRCEDCRSKGIYENK
jgi:DNA-directed RNA polymerase subunit RPC12/RpoP